MISAGDEVRIRFESHAENQVKERALSRAQIEETLVNPDQLIDSRKGRKIAQKVFKIGTFKFLLRAIYVIEGPDFVVISAYRTTKIEKYWVNK